MSSGISVYSLPLEKLTQTLGSRNQPLIDKILKSHADFLSSIDEINEEAESTCAQALAALINNEIPENAPGYLYGYALQALCSHLGEELTSVDSISGTSDWLNEVDAALQSKSIPFKLTNLVYSGSPVPIPEPDDYPFIGTFPADQIPTALAALKSADLTTPQDMTEILTQIRDWLQSTAKTPNHSLIGFLS